MSYLPTQLPNAGLSNLLSKNGLSDIKLFQREILILQAVVAGTSFRDIHKVENQLIANTKLVLKREADNKYDQLAVKIELEDYLLGYIPKENNEVLARLMDAGKNFHAVVHTLEWQGNWARLVIQVFLND